MARNYSLVKQHVAPSRRQWMAANAPRGKVRSLSTEPDLQGDMISIMDFVRYWNMLISCSSDHELQAYLLKAPGTAQELQTTMKTIESIMKKKAGIADEEEKQGVDKLTPQDLSTLADATSLLGVTGKTPAVRESMRDLATGFRERAKPFGEANQEEQDRRVRRFWG